MSYPEKQCWQNIQDSEKQEDWDEASPEEKEPTIIETKHAERWQKVQLRLCG